MEYKDVYILAEEANTYDTPNRSIEAGIFTDAFIKGYNKAVRWVSVEERLPEKCKTITSMSIPNDELLVLFYKPYSSLEFGVLKDSDSWEIPDVGVVALEDVTHWLKLPSFPKP